MFNWRDVRAALVVLVKALALTRLAETALQVVRPAVIWAAEVFGASAPHGGCRGIVSADVVEGAQHPVVPSHDDIAQAERHAGEVVAGRGHLRRRTGMETIKTCAHELDFGRVRGSRLVSTANGEPAAIEDGFSLRLEHLSGREGRLMLAKQAQRSCWSRNLK